MVGASGQRYVHVHLTSAPVHRRGPVGVFNALFGAASLPASLREGMADYNLVKCYVLLHDLTTGPANSQAAADGLQAAPCSALRCGERPAVCMPCTPHAGQGGGGALAAPMLPLMLPYGAPLRCRPPPAARPLHPKLPLSMPTAGDLARLRPRRVQAATDQLARRRRAAAARPVDGRTAARVQPHGRRAPSAQRAARCAAVRCGHGAGAHPDPDPDPTSAPTPTLALTPTPTPGRHGAGAQVGGGASRQARARPPAATRSADQCDGQGQPPRGQEHGAFRPWRGGREGACMFTLMACA